MIEFVIHYLQLYILPLGAFGVFVASVAEEVIAPIPSALIMTMSGFLFVSGSLSLQTILDLVFKVAIPAALGVTIGSYFIYFLARFGGLFIIEKYGKYVGLFLKDIETLQNRLSGSLKDEILIILSRITPFVPSVAISAFCGVIKMNPFKYFYISFVGVFIRGLILGCIGWQVGNVYEKYAKLFSSIENVVLIVLLVLVATFVMLKYKKNKI